MAQRSLVAGQEGDQVPAGPVGPVRVLHDDHQGRRLRQPLEQAQELLEEPGAGLARGNQATLSAGQLG